MPTRLILSLACAAALLASTAGGAEPLGSLAGHLRERGTRRPLVGVAVQVSGAPDEVFTDAAGDFLVEGLPPGPVTIRVHDEACEPLEDEETIRPGRRTEVTWYLTPTGFDDGGVTVVGRRPQKEVAQHSVQVREITTIPGASGDALQVVQALPGAARLPFGQADIVLRGGGDSRTTLNGQWLPGAFHFGGLRSVISSALIESLEIQPGGQGAAEGRGNGGVVEIVTRRPRDDRLGGHAQADAFDAELFVEGPLTAHGTFAISARRSYIDALLPAFLDEDSPFSTAPRYWDLQAAYDHRQGDHRISTVLFGSSDAMVLLFDEPLDTDPALRGDLVQELAWIGAQTTWTAQLGDATTHRLLLGYLRDDERTATGPDFNLDLVIDFLTVRDELEHRFSEAFALRGGLDVELIWGDFDVIAPSPPQEGEVTPPLSATPSKRADVQTFYGQPAAWIEADVHLGRLLLVPGLRVDHATDLDATAVQPRLAARWAVAEGTTLKGSAGLYVEAPDIALTNATFGNDHLGYERSAQYSAGIEQHLGEVVSLDVTGFFKSFDDLAVKVPDPAVKVSGQGEGRAYGAEVLLRHAPRGRFHGWIAYTWLRSERRDAPDDAYRPFDLDQTHHLSVVGQLRLGPTWEVGTRFRYVTGNPDTPLTGATYDSDVDTFVPRAGRYNSDRLPAFHELDVRVDKRWLFDTWTLTTYLEVQNVYNRANPEGFSYNYDYTRRTSVAGLPLLPSFGVRGDF
ncbi:MAG: TonB-dependent receptor [bacterium]